MAILGCFAGFFLLIVYFMSKRINKLRNIIIEELKKQTDNTGKESRDKTASNIVLKNSRNKPYRSVADKKQISGWGNPPVEIYSPFKNYEKSGGE